jgi:hypothetical protein
MFFIDKYNRIFLKSVFVRTDSFYSLLHATREEFKEIFT